MSSQFNIDNNGIGGTPFLTFTVDTNVGRNFIQSDLDNNLTACVISGNNEVGMGSADDKLIGGVVWVSHELQAGTTIPVLCAVQARGVVRFKFEGGVPDVMTSQGTKTSLSQWGVVASGNGKVLLSAGEGKRDVRRDNSGGNRHHEGSSKGNRLSRGTAGN